MSELNWLVYCTLARQELRRLSHFNKQHIFWSMWLHMIVWSPCVPFFLRRRLNSQLLPSRARGVWPKWLPAMLFASLRPDYSCQWTFQPVCVLNFALDGWVIVGSLSWAKTNVTLTSVLVVAWCRSYSVNPSTRHAETGDVVRMGLKQSRWATQTDNRKSDGR